MEHPSYLLLLSMQKIKPRFGLGVQNKLTLLGPAIQSKTSTWSAVNLKKANAMTSKLEPAISSRDTGQGILCFDRCQLTIT